MNNAIIYKESYLNINKGIVIFICMTLLWRVWVLPRDFPFPFSMINVIGMNKISLAFILLYLFDKYRNKESLLITFLQWKWLLIFLLGVGISIFYNLTFREGTLRMRHVGNLSFDSIIIGAAFYFMFIYFYSYKNILEQFFKISLIVAFFFYVLIILGIAKEVVMLISSGSLYYAEEGKYAYETTMKISRIGFPTMDDNSFGPLASIFLIIGLYKYRCLQIWQKKYKVFLLLFFILSVIVMLKTISRSTIIIGIFQLTVFIYLSSKNKPKTIILGFSAILVFFVFLQLQILPGLKYITALQERFYELIYNIPIYLGQVQKPSDIGYDNFHARIIMSQTILPANLTDLIFGTGGISEGVLKKFQASSHIDIVNWIVQWGLITLIPLLFFFSSMLFFLFKWDVARIKTEKTPVAKNELFLLRNLAISILLGIMIMWLNSPLFFLFWFSSGLTISIIIILIKMEKTHKVFLRSTNKFK